MRSWENKIYMHVILVTIAVFIDADKAPNKLVGLIFHLLIPAVKQGFLSFAAIPKAIIVVVKTFLKCDKLDRETGVQFVHSESRKV
jgi:hypothetical protein